MEFWKVLKIFLMAVFAGILAGSFLLADNDTQPTQQPVQQSGSKFNF